jgi:hypothetical protein
MTSWKPKRKVNLERRVKLVGKNYFAFVDIFINKETNMPTKRWRCIACGEVIDTTYLEDGLLKHMHKKIRVKKLKKEINFKKGDILIGLEESNKYYKNTNSSALVQVEEILDRNFFGDKDVVVRILAFDFRDEPEKTGKSYLVCSSHFRKATDKDKAKFLANFL